MDGKTTHDQTHDDMWMNMFLRDTRCDTLSHAEHVNKDEMCANVREKTLCAGVLFTFQRERGQQTFKECSDFVTRRTKNTNGWQRIHVRRMPLFCRPWPGSSLKPTCGNGAYRTKLGQRGPRTNTRKCQRLLMLVPCGVARAAVPSCALFLLCSDVP